MSCAICFNLDQSKILSSGNGLNKSIAVLVKIIIESNLFADDHLIIPIDPLQHNANF